MSSRKFQIVGLPRSGTAWVSTVFNMDESVLCYHECITLPNITDPIATIEEDLKVYDFVGDACGTCIDLPRAREGARKVFIERDPQEAMVSAEIALERQIGFERWKKIHQKISEWRNLYHPLTISFDDLFTVDGMHKVWQHCVDVPFPADKVENMIGMKVEKRDMNYNVSRIEEKRIKVYEKWGI